MSLNAAPELSHEAILPEIESNPTRDYTTPAERLKLLAHPERLRILDVLRREPECVCHLEALLRKPQPYVSQQLRVLRHAGVILDEKRGNNVYYRLTDDELRLWLDCVLGPVVQEDAELAFYKATIACPCPKCDETDSTSNP